MASARADFVIEASGSHKLLPQHEIALVSGNSPLRRIKTALSTGLHAFSIPEGTTYVFISISPGGVSFSINLMQTPTDVGPRIDGGVTLMPVAGPGTLYLKRTGASGSVTPTILFF